MLNAIIVYCCLVICDIFVCPVLRVLTRIYNLFELTGYNFVLSIYLFEYPVEIEVKKNVKI